MPELIKTLYSFTLTKLFYRGCRLVRRPIYIRGRKSIIGCKGLTTGYRCRFDLDGDRPTLFIGDNCEMGDMTHIVAHEKVEIGDNVLIASKCFISDTNHGNYKGINQCSPESIPSQRPLVSAPVKIGDRVWLGENVVILAGSTIGSGCIIGANSVVTTNIPDNSIAVGSPARVIKVWNENEDRWEKV